MQCLSSKNRRDHFAAILISLIGLLAFAVLQPANAQPIAIDPEAVESNLIEFKPEPKMGDYVGRAEGVIDSGSKRFHLKGLDVMAPTVIQVLAKDPAKPINVSLHRYFWREKNKEGSTGDDGYWGYAGRIHDEVGIELTADDATEYYILAWRSPRIDSVPRANLFVPADNIASTGSTSSNDGGIAGVPMWALIAIIVLLAAIVALLFKNQRQRGAAAIGFLLFSLSGVTALEVRAQDGELRFDPTVSFGDRMAAVEDMVEALHSRLFEFSRWADNRMDFIEAQIESAESAAEERLREETDLLRQRINDVNDLLESVNESTQEGIERALSRADRNAENLLDISGHMVDLWQAQDAVNRVLSQQIQQLRLLVERDREMIPDGTYGGVDPMPSSCYGNPACSACFAEVNREFVQQMDYYEQLRVIYSNYRTFAEYVIVAGDMLSGFHQLEQAAWYAIRLEIKAAEGGVSSAYNRKFDEYNVRLNEILLDFGHCEARAGVHGWYERHGKLFYNSLINAYRIYDVAWNLP